MPYYLKFPADSGTAAGNNKLVQLSGIAKTGNVNIALEFAENVVDPVTTASKSVYLYDGRRQLNSTASGTGGYFLENNNAITQLSTSNYQLNGSASTNTGWRTALADDVYSFDSGAQSDGVIAIGARFSQTESFPLLALKSIIITDSAGTHVVDMSSSGGSANTFTSTDGVITLSLFGFTGTSHWVFYSSGGTSWEGTVGKTSLSTVNKSLSINTGQLLSPSKVTLTLSTKQQSISTGFVATNGKTSLTLSPKQESINVGYINTLSKLGLALLQKQLSITVGANLPFTGVIGKATYASNGKQLGLALGWNGGVDKSTLPVGNKQESVLAGFVNTINEINIPVNGKPLNLQTGTSISYVGTINKGSLNVSGKPLNVVAGTSIPFIGLMQKTSLTLTGKQLGVVRGQVLDLQKQALNIVGKQLSLGEIVYPIVPIERVFTIKDGDRIHYFKQTTTVYVMKNN